MCVIRKDLEEKLKLYDRVFLFCSETIWFETTFALSDALKETDKSVWIYSVHAMNYPDKIHWRRISREEEKEIRRIYYMYEFSNHICVISCNEMYGSLFHYVNRELLTTEEIIEALLY